MGSGNIRSHQTVRLAADALARMAGPAASMSPVVFVPDGVAAHRLGGVRELARRIARLRCSPMIDLPDAVALYPHCSAVPAATLVGSQLAAALGVERETDLYGGLVPYAVQAGKAITHALADEEAARPEGWSPGFGAAIRKVVLDGFSAFDGASASRAGRRLPQRGAMRLKPGWADGGHGQSIVADAGALDAALDACDDEHLAGHGLVIEENLSEGAVFSIGRVRIGVAILCYLGRQGITTDNAGADAYGGSPWCRGSSTGC